MIQVHWKLKPYLEQNTISAHKLALEAGISPPNLYTLIRGEGAKNVSRETLAKLIGALRRLTGQPVAINDVLEIIEEPILTMDLETRAWHDCDISRLGEIEPYDWGDLDPNTLGRAVINGIVQ